MRTETDYNFLLFLPLITTKCAVLAVPLFQTSRGYSLLQAVVFAHASSGYTLALHLMSEARERLELLNSPDLTRGAVATLASPLPCGGCEEGESCKRRDKKQSRCHDH